MKGIFRDQKTANTCTYILSFFEISAVTYFVPWVEEDNNRSVRGCASKRTAYTIRYQRVVAAMTTDQRCRRKTRRQSVHAISKMFDFNGKMLFTYTRECARTSAA